MCIKWQALTCVRSCLFLNGWWKPPDRPWFWLLYTALCPTMVVFGWKSCIFRCSYLAFQRVANLTRGTGYKLFWVAGQSFCSRDPWNCLTGSSKRQATICLVHFYKRCVSNDRLWLASDLVFFLMADESHLIRSMVLATISGTLSNNGGIWLEKLYF